MSVNDFKAWMDRNNKTTVDIASITGFNPNTIDRYLKGENVHRSTRRVLESLITQQVQPAGKSATG